MGDIYPYPVFLNLAGRICVVVGGGSVAARKIHSLFETGAVVTVIASTVHASIEELAVKGSITLLRRDFEAGDIGNAFLVIAATDNDSVNAAVSREARDRGVLVNAVDEPSLSDFFSGSVLSRGPLRIAVSTSGRCPGIARTIRCQLEKIFDDTIGDFIRIAGEMRSRILEITDTEKREKAIAWLSNEETFNLYRRSGEKTIWETLLKLLSS